MIAQWEMEPLLEGKIWKRNGEPPYRGALGNDGAHRHFLPALLRKLWTFFTVFWGLHKHTVFSRGFGPAPRGTQGNKVPKEQVLPSLPGGNYP